MPPAPHNFLKLSSACVAGRRLSWFVVVAAVACSCSCNRPRVCTPRSCSEPSHERELFTPVSRMWWALHTCASYCRVVVLCMLHMYTAERVEAREYSHSEQSTPTWTQSSLRGPARIAAPSVQGSGVQSARGDLDALRVRVVLSVTDCSMRACQWKRHLAEVIYGPSLTASAPPKPIPHDHAIILLAYMHFHNDILNVLGSGRHCDDSRADVGFVYYCKRGQQRHVHGTR